MTFWREVVDVPIPADVTDGYEVGGCGLESDCEQLFVGDVMVQTDVFEGPQSSAVEAADHLCQGFCKGPRYCSIKENRVVQGIVNTQLRLP